MRETFAGKEMLDRAAEGLDLSQTSTHSTFIERFKAERQKHPELNSLTITSLDIKDLPAH